MNEDQGEEQMIENKDDRTKEQTSHVKIKNNWLLTEWTKQTRERREISRAKKK